MSVGLQLLAAICAGNDCTKLNYPEHLFIGDAEIKAHQMMLNFTLSYGALPTPEALDDAGIELPLAAEPIEYYYDRCRRRYLKVALKTTMLEAGDMLNAGSEFDALESLTASVSGLVVKHNHRNMVDFSQSALDIVTAAFLGMEGGENVGFSMGWPSLDSMAGGLRGGDIVTICGRPGAGKTYLMLYAAMHMWKMGKVPLFISMEMKPLPIIQRLTAMLAIQPISPLMHGSLWPENWIKVQTALTEAQNQHPFWIVDGSLSSTIQDAVFYSQQMKPDVVFIDAAYLLKHPNSKLSRWDRATENMEMMKADLAEGLNVPVVCSHQLNREAEKKIKKGKKAELGVEDIAYTDAIGQVSSCVLGLLQEEKQNDVEILNQREVTILKGRNGESGEFHINWRFDKPPFMDFTEIDPDIEKLNYA